MSEIPAAPEVARRLADALEAAEIPYAIGGAIAYGLYAPPRATNDVDLNIFLDPDRLGPALDALETLAVVDRDEVRESAAKRGDFQVRVSGMRIDVFIMVAPVLESASRRVRTGTLLGRPVKILAAEDLILFKLLFFRSKDLSDVERLVRFAGDDLDKEYVRRWLVEMVGEDSERVRVWDRLVGREP